MQSEHEPIEPKVGDVICDMHYGLDLSRLPGYGLTGSLRLDVEFGHVVLKTLLASQQADGNYVNKLMQVVSVNRDGSLIAAYSYDGTHLTFVELSAGTGRVAPRSAADDSGHTECPIDASTLWDAPLELVFGDGQVLIHTVTNQQGSYHGVLFTRPPEGSSFECGHEFTGAEAQIVEGDPVPGELHFRFKTAKSVDLLIQVLSEVRDELRARESNDC